MDTIELQYILDHGLPSLHGRVCAKDQLPTQKPSYVKAYIVNTHKADQPGEHWVAIFFHGDRATYFDSYGQPPSDTSILSFLEKNSQYWTYNNVRLQGQLPVCGVYCIYVLTYLARHYSLKEIICAHTTPGGYDLPVMKWFKRHYKRLYNQATRLPKTDVCQECGSRIVFHCLLQC